jgi:hypothetical protein
MRCDCRKRSSFSKLGWSGSNYTTIAILLSWLNNKPNGSPLFRLTEALSKIDGVKVFPCGGVDEGKLSLYFTYKQGYSSIEEKVRFIDWLARILGNSDDEAGYDTHVAMWWTGNKGVNGENEPFFTIDVLLRHVEAFLNILTTNIGHDTGEAHSFTLRANCHNKASSIVKTASIPFNRIWATKVKFCMVFAVGTLALVARSFKSRIASFLIRFPLWHMKIIEGDNQVCQS